MNDLFPCRRQALVVIFLLAAMQVTSGCASSSDPLKANARIDRLYLATADALNESSQSRPAEVQGLADEINKLAAADLSRDPCLSYKRSQLMPVLLSLAVIDKIRDQEEKSRLQAEAREHLLALADPADQPGVGYQCNGQGFPKFTRQ